MSKLSTQVDQSNQMYFEVGWVKPGRHIFVIEHDQGGEIRDADDVYGNRLQGFMADKMRQGK